MKCDCGNEMVYNKEKDRYECDKCGLMSIEIDERQQSSCFGRN